jgi:hypothetical protein
MKINITFLMALKLIPVQAHGKSKKMQTTIKTKPTKHVNNMMCLSIVVLFVVSY